MAELNMELSQEKLEEIIAAHAGDEHGVDPENILVRLIYRQPNLKKGIQKTIVAKVSWETE